MKWTMPPSSRAIANLNLAVRRTAHSSSSPIWARSFPLLEHHPVARTAGGSTPTTFISISHDRHPVPIADRGGIHLDDAQCGMTDRRTDYHNILWPGASGVRRLDLEPREQEQIRYGNARRLF